MNIDTEIARIVAIVGGRKSFAIALNANPTVDAISAGLALYLALNKLGKAVAIASSASIPPDLQTQLVAADKIQKKLGSEGDSLVISFPYTDGAIDKVTYTIEDGYFNLLVQPKENQTKLDPSQVRYTYAGGKIDAVVTIDAPSPEYLGELYTLQPEEFKNRDIINIDRHLTNTQFGTVNAVGKNFSSTSEIVLKIIQTLAVEITPEMATNLFLGIKEATNNFTAYSVNHQTFENCAYLLKVGAAKRPAKSAPAAKSFGAPIAETVNDQAAPPDWLKPKIFKGSNLI